MGAFRLKVGFGNFKILSQVLNGTVGAFYPFCPGNSLGMDVIKDVLLSIDRFAILNGLRIESTV